MSPEKLENYLGAIKGHQAFPSFPFNDLEVQAASQSSFVSIRLVDSIRIACTALSLFSARYEVYEGH